MFFLKISKVLHNPSPISPRQDRGMSQQCSNPVPLKLNILLLTEGLDDMSKVRHYWSTLHPAKVLTPRNIRFLLPFLFYNFALHHFLRPYFIKLEYTEKPFLTLKVNKQGIWLNDVMSLSSSLDPLIPPLIEGLQMPVNKRFWKLSRKIQFNSKWWETLWVHRLHAFAVFKSYCDQVSSFTSLWNCNCLITSSALDLPVLIFASWVLASWNFY